MHMQTCSSCVRRISQCDYSHVPVQRDRMTDSLKTKRRSDRRGDKEKDLNAVNAH
jgi:hypothetical protein